MNKILLLLCFATLCANNPLMAQKTQTSQPNPQTQTQKKPPPYVYRTDYDVKMKEVDGKVNSAVGTAQALKRELTGKLDKVDELDTKMLQVEEILNSANFKIGLTSDSLKKTRFSVEEFKANTDKKMGEMNAITGFNKKLIFGAMGLAVLLSLGVVLMMNSRMRKQRNAMQRQSEEFSTRLTDDMERQRKAFSDELVQFKLRIQDDINRLKTEIKSGAENTAAQLAQIMEKLDSKDV